ncbi:MAG TPA: NAD-dependent epimerase/dehydratase family protein [archaeon]|nr:NAD-dependent epimerase/dehydratase family protein [archaeon]
MAVLVTGTTGAIGAHLAKRLLDRGETVVGIIHDKHPKKHTTLDLLGITDSIYLAHGDLLDLTFVKRVASDYEVDKIFHLAALPIVRVGNVSPVPIFKTNVEGTWNVMEAAKENNSKVLYVSTDKVYGHHGTEPYKETFALNGLNIYDASKAMGDQVVRAYNFVYGTKTVVSRSCNIYGPADLNSRLIPNTIRNCLKGENPQIFEGIDYIREWIYIDDVVDAFLLLMDNIEKTNGQAWNIGTGFTAAQELVISEVLKHFPGMQAKIVQPPPYTKKEIPYQKLDTEKITTTFGWRPKVSFEEGVRRTVEWWKANKHLALSGP